MPAGRPTIFSQQLSEKICELAQKGKTIDEMADILNINRRTIYFWMQNKPEFLHALKEARQAADEIVESSLYHRAIGYSVPEEKVFCNANGEVTKVTTMKHYPPDPTAMIFWLKNRQHENWRDKTEVEQTGSILLGAASREQLVEMCLEAQKGKLLDETKKQIETPCDDD